ncbi:MAG: oligoendopeptidase F [Chlamydiia bacterium]
MVGDRGDLPPAYVWDLTALCPSAGDWEMEMKRLDEQRLASWSRVNLFRGRLTDVTTICAALGEYFSIQRVLGKLCTYAMLRHDEDLSHTLHGGMRERSHIMEMSLRESTSWLEPELVALEEGLWQELLKASEAAPYRQWLRQLHHTKAHVLPPGEERLMAMAGMALAAPKKAFTALNNVDLQFGEVLDGEGQKRQLTHGLYQVYMKSQDRVLRENAFTGLFEQYGQHLHTITELLNGEMQSQLFQARGHRYRTCLEAALMPLDIPESVYTDLLEVVHEYSHVLHRYVELRRRILGLTELHSYDLHVPLVQEVQLDIPYEQACQWVIESVAPLGEEYQAAVRHGLMEGRWVDVHEAKGKRSGAYSSGCYDSPPYVLMNYRGTLTDVFTLAHEIGHSMHSFLSNRNNSYAEAPYTLFAAEVASTLNEQLLFDLLLKTLTSPQQQVYLLNQKLEEIRSTLLRQTLFAEFELWLHQQVEEGIPLSVESLNEKYRALIHVYYGDALFLDPAIAWEWSRIPHFYYGYYVYQYATGLSCALSFHQQIVKEGRPAIERYLRFLKSGGSKFPVEILEQSGVDIRHGGAVRAALEEFEGLVEQLSKKL